MILLLLYSFLTCVDEEVSLELSVLIDADYAPILNMQSPNLEDILILHLDGGKDFFVSVIGNYLISCFGSSLETLIHLHTYIREVPTAQLLDLTMVSTLLASGWDIWFSLLKYVKD